MARHKSKSDTKINNFTQFKEEDNLRLSEMTIPEIPKDILFPDELNQYLRGQVQFLTHSNGMLQKNMSEKDILIENYNHKINNLTAKISEYEQCADKSQSGVLHLVSAKIVELSKKVRDKNAEIESLKTKCAKMQQKLFDLENNIPKNEPKFENKITETTDEKVINYEDELKMLQEKLSQTTNKLFEQKNINYQLKNELKTANKVLQQELGDNFTSIQSISVGSSNWRGRAQQILSLQQKNSELLEKLSLQSDTGTDASINSNKSDNRKLIIEQLQKELTNEKNTTEDLRKKLNGARARTKVLETECFNSKTKLNSLTEKSHHDADLIQFLTNQISNMEEGQNNIRKEKQNIIQKLEEEIKNLKIEISKDKCMIDNFKEKLSDKEFRINELENEMRYGRNSARSSSISIVSHDSVKENNRIKQLQLEIQRLLELTADLNARLDHERIKHSEIQINFRKEKQKASKLELKLSRIELESSMNKSTTYSSKSATKLSVTNSCHIDNNCLSLETLKNSLELAEENISVLKTRLDILQKEKELDFQRFSVILAESTGILKKSVSSGKIQE